MDGEWFLNAFILIVVVCLSLYVTEAVTTYFIFRKYRKHTKEKHNATQRTRTTRTG